MTAIFPRVTLAVGGVLLVAACGAAPSAGQSEHPSRQPTPKPQITVSTEVPADIPQLAYKFAPYVSTVGVQAPVSAQVAIQAAKDTGVESDSWTHDPASTAALAMFTDTTKGTRQADGSITRTYQDVPAWVIIGSGVKLYPVGPHGTKPTPVPAGNVCWIVNARTGHYLEAGDFAPQ